MRSKSKILNHINVFIFLSYSLVVFSSFFDSFLFKNSTFLIVGIVLWVAAYRRQEESSKRFDIFSPAISFPIFYILIFGFGIFTLYLGIGYSYRAIIDARLIYYVLMGFIFSVSGILIGFGLSVVDKDKIFNANIVNSLAKDSQLRFWGFVILGFGILSFVIYYGFLVGIPLLAKGDSIRHNVRPNTYGLGLLFMLLQGAGFLSISSIILSLRYKKTIPKIHVFLGFFSVVLTALSGYRWIVILYMLVSIVCFNYIKSRIVISFNLKRYIAFLLILVVLFSFIGLVGYKRFSGNENKYIDGLLAMNISPEYKIIAPAFLSMQTPIASFSYLIDKIPQLHDYFYGKYNLAQVPGISLVLYKNEKDNPFVYITNEIFGLDFRGSHGATAISFLGNFYVDGGGFVIIIGSLFVGFCLSHFYCKMVKTCNIYDVTVYAFYLITSIKWILVGFYIGDFRLLLMIFLAKTFLKVKVRKKYMCKYIVKSPLFDPKIN